MKRISRIGSVCGRLMDVCIAGSIRVQLLVLAAVHLIIIVITAALLYSQLFHFPEPASSETPGGNLWLSFSHATSSDYMGSTHDAPSRILDMFVSFGGWFLLQVLLVSVLVNAYERRGRRVRNGHVRYYFKDEQAAVLGWGAMGVSVVEQLAKTNRKVIILSLEAAEAIRAQLKTEFSHRPEINLRNIYVFTGSFDSYADLRNLNVMGAAEIVILGDRGVRGGDSRNLQAATRILQFREDKRYSFLTAVYVHISDLRSYDLIQDIDMPVGSGRYTALYPFNFFEDWARRLWCVIPEQTSERVYPPLAYTDDVVDPDSKSYVHLVIIGFGQMGQAVAIQAARIAHYAAGRKTRITAIDTHMEVKQPCFQSHCHVDDIYDVEFYFIQEQAESLAVRELLSQSTADPDQILTVAICLSDPDLAMGTALSLPKEIVRRDVPILVRQETRSGLSTLAEKIQEQPKWKDLYFFGMLDECYGLERRQDRVAMQIHSNYQEQARAEGWYDPDRPRFRNWFHLQERYRWSNRYQADAYFERLRAFGYNLDFEADQEPCTFATDQLERLAASEHDRWWAERLLGGWRYGERDNFKLLHPDLIPFADLDEKMKAYDRNAMAAMPRHLKQIYGVDCLR